MSVFLGDGSFEDCVRLGLFTEIGREEFKYPDLENGYFPALGSASVPAVVVDYVGSALPGLDLSFSRWYSMSAGVAAERLRKDYVRDKMRFRNTTYEFSKCFSGLGKRLYYYKLFEPGDDVAQGRGYGNYHMRISHSQELGVGLPILQELANSSTPMDVVKSNFDVDCVSHDSVFRSVFFNKNLSFDDVVWLWDSMVCQSNSCFLECPHVFLLQSVLLRDDWSEDELRFFFEWWVNHSSVLYKRLTGEESRNEFKELSKSVRILFASNVSTPVDLLLNLFECGDESVRSAVVRNSAVGKDFVFDVINGGVIDSSVVRESALLNPVWNFEELVKITEDEGESVGVRFAALFNENVPPFYRELYSL